MSYTWSFEVSFLVFLVIVFASEALAGKLKSLVPMPLIFGVLLIAGFSLGWLPRDMVLASNMIAVGTIAFHVLVIHSGTMVDAKLLKREWRSAVICLVSTVAVVLVVGFALSPLLGRELALLAPGSILGGGASCAIASRWVMDKNPAISVFPWMIFMFQGLFSVPVVTWALRRESKALLAEYRTRENDRVDGDSLPRTPAGNSAERPAGPPQDALHGPSAKVPSFMKTTAYYLGGLMLISVLNRLLHSTVLAPLGIHLNVNSTALLLGVALGLTGVMEKGPLFKSNSYGLLLLGLMGLMANTMANNQLGHLLGLLPPLLLAFAISTILLCGCGALLAKWLNTRPLQGVILTMNSMMGFPVNGMLVKNAAAIGATEAERGYLSSRMGPMLGIGTMLISNGVSIFIVSLMVRLV